LFLPRASPGHPISRCLNFFTASGGKRGGKILTEAYENEKIGIDSEKGNGL
jgi:hypothetical protein